MTMSNTPHHSGITCYGARHQAFSRPMRRRRCGRLRPGPVSASHQSDPRLETTFEQTDNTEVGVMYGMIARATLKPGKQAELDALLAE